MSFSSLIFHKRKLIFQSSHLRWGRGRGHLGTGDSESIGHQDGAHKDEENGYRPADKKSENDVDPFDRGVCGVIELLCYFTELKFFNRPLSNGGNSHGHDNRGREKIADTAFCEDAVMKAPNGQDDQLAAAQRNENYCPVANAMQCFEKYGRDRDKHDANYETGVPVVFVDKVRGTVQDDGCGETDLGRGKKDEEASKRLWNWIRHLLVHQQNQRTNGDSVRKDCKEDDCHIDTNRIVDAHHLLDVFEVRLEDKCVFWAGLVREKVRVIHD